MLIFYIWFCQIPHLPKHMWRNRYIWHFNNCVILYLLDLRMNFSLKSHRILIRSHMCVCFLFGQNPAVQSDLEKFLGREEGESLFQCNKDKASRHCKECCSGCCWIHEVIVFPGLYKCNENQASWLCMKCCSGCNSLTMENFIFKAFLSKLQKRSRGWKFFKTNTFSYCIIVILVIHHVC